MTERPSIHLQLCATCARALETGGIAQLKRAAKHWPCLKEVTRLEMHVARRGLIDPNSQRNNRR